MGMMKKWLLIFTLTLLISLGIFYWKRSTPKPTPVNDKVLSVNEIPTPSPSPAAWPQSTVLDVDSIPIRISWAIVNPNAVELYDNLKEQKLSEEIKVNKSCKILVNGGFYSENKTHLGLFVADFKTVSDSIQSALFNGFLWINADNKVLISADDPGNTPRLGLQSGPLLMLGNKTQLLAINNDEPARRIVAGITDSNQLIFLVFYRELSEYEGPMLGKLPEIIELFKQQTGLKITDAINLDGGSHSVFISNYDLLREQNIIGSYFCAAR